LRRRALPRGDRSFSRALPAQKIDKVVCIDARGFLFRVGGRVSARDWFGADPETRQAAV
jgi:hypothetical protein